MTVDQEILFDDAPRAALLATGGRRVWPVRSREEADALQAMVHLFGGRLSRTRGEPVAGCPRGAEGGVAALGEAVLAEAELYAHLTRRPLVLARTIEEIDPNAGLEIVVLSYADLTSDLIERLHGARIGLVCALDPVALRRQVLVRAAAAGLGGRPEVQRVEVALLGGPAQPRRAGVVRLDGETPAADILSALGAGAGTLVMASHSDGLDADLGPSLTLCPLDRPPLAFDPTRVPPCTLRKVCIRRRKSIDDAQRAGELVPPEAVRARVFVWTSCNPITLPASPIIHPAWSLSERFFNSPTVGAVAVTWESTLRSDSAEPLCRALDEGAQVGAALDELHASPAARRTGYRMLLFGDPRTRATVPSAARAELETAPAPRPTVAASDDLGLLIAAMTAHERTAPPVAAAKTRRALDTARSYEAMAWAGAASPAAAERLREEVLQYLFYRDAFDGDWWPYAARIEAVLRDGRCPTCGSWLKTYVASFRIPNVTPRRRASCPACHTVRDTPAGFEASLTALDGRTLRLEGPLPKEPCTVGVRCNVSNQLALFRWPIVEGGALATEAEFPRDALPFPARAAVYVVSGTRVLALFAHLAGARREEPHLRATRPALIAVPVDRALVDEDAGVTGYDPRPPESRAS
jgi:hypothetical protein